MPKYRLYASLGQCVIVSDPPQKDRLTLLNTVSVREGGREGGGEGGRRGGRK